MAVKCLKCGHENPEHIVYCGQCGESLIASPTSPQDYGEGAECRERTDEPLRTLQRRGKSKRMGDTLQAITLLLGICSFIACATALFVSWHYIHIEIRYPADDYEHYDRIENFAFLMDKPLVYRWTEAFGSPGIFYSTYDGAGFDAVGSLLGTVKMICLFSLAAIVMSTIATLRTTWRATSVLALFAPVLIGVVILLFSMGFPSAMTEGLETTNYLSGDYSDDISGLYGSVELYQEYDNSTVMIDWDLDYSWWLMIAAFAMTLAQAVLTYLYPPSGMSLKTTLLGRR